MSSKIRRLGAGWYGERSSLFKTQCGRRKSKEWGGFVSPEGVPYGPIINLAAFCREHDLDPSAMRLVSIGQYQSHHGWTRLEDDSMVVPLPFFGGGKDLYLWKEETSECFGPIHSERDVGRCSNAVGFPSWIVRELLSGERTEHQGWRREES